MVPKIPLPAGGSNTTPDGKLVWIWLKLSVMVKALADAGQVAGAPAGSKGSTPTARRTAPNAEHDRDWGLTAEAEDWSTNPTAGLS